MPEHRIETTETIAAAPDRVWRTLTDWQRMPEWNPFIRSINGSLEVGARLSVHIVLPGRGGMRFRPKVLVAGSGRELRWRGSLLIHGLFDGEHYFLLEPDGSGGTRFIHGETFSGFLVPLFGRGALEATRQGFEAMNRALKQVVEAQEIAQSGPLPEAPSFIDVEEERPEHCDAVDKLTREAFGGNYEADLLKRLRRDGLVVSAFVALEDDKVIGHVMLSELPTRVDGRSVKAACVAPLSVSPLYRQQGIGAKLVERAISALRDQGYEAAFVLGNTRYYARFGFSSSVARKIECPFPGEAFMAFEIVPGALRGEKGAVKYPKAFRLDA